MTEREDKERVDGGMLDLITSVATSLSAPVLQGLSKAFGALVGELTSIPRAWIRSVTQSIDDGTAARSEISRSLAAIVAQNAANDPEIVKAAAQVYLPTAFRKAKNRVEIAQRVIPIITEIAANEPEAEGGAPSDDWMNAFIRYAEDATSETLQEQFARLLAGEIARKGSFSLRSIRALAEMDPPTAARFSAVWEKGVGSEVDYDEDFQRGDWFGKWRFLVEAGLMAPNTAAQFLPPQNSNAEGNTLWTPVTIDGVALTIHFPEGCNARWSYLEFTQVGREIGSLLPKPDYARNLRKMGRRLALQGVTRVVLQQSGKPDELLYQAPKP
jgi:hypothetical protein